MKLWKDSKRSTAQELITWLLEVKNESGWTVERVNTIAFSELSCSSVSPSELTEVEIMVILSEMVREGKKSADEFETIYTQRRRNDSIARQKNTDTWHFYIPVHLSFNPKIRLPVHVKILDTEFAFLTRNTITRNVGKEVMSSPTKLRHLTGQAIKNIPDLFMSVSSNGIDWKIAWGLVEPAFNAFRGLIELTLGFGGWRWGDHQKARSEVPHPLWLLTKRGNGEIEGLQFDIEDTSSGKPHELTTQELQLIRYNCRFLQKEPTKESTLAIIADCLRLYSQAMDARFSYSCFLGLWQLAEALTLSETVGGQTDKVVERLAWHGSDIGLKASGYTDTLRAYAKKRNDIVHRGIHSVDDDEVNTLKFACELALMWLIREHKNITNTAQLNQFYRLRETNDTELEALGKAIEHVRTTRNKA